MAIAREFFGPGWTGQQYDQLIGKMDLGGNSAEGVLFHWAAVTDDGVHAVDVYESVEAADALAATKVGPAAGALGLTPPQIRQYDVRSYLTPSSAVVRPLQVLDGCEPAAGAVSSAPVGSAGAHGCHG